MFFVVIWHSWQQIRSRLINFGHDSSAEIIWTIIPIIILIAIIVPTMNLLYMLDIQAPHQLEIYESSIPVEITAIGRQWFWQYNTKWFFSDEKWYSLINNRECRMYMPDNLKFNSKSHNYRFLSTDTP